MSNAFASVRKTLERVLCTLLSALMALLLIPALVQPARAYDEKQLAFGETIWHSANLGDATYKYEEFTSEYTFTLAEETEVRLTANGECADPGHSDDFRADVIVRRVDPWWEESVTVVPEQPTQLDMKLSAGTYCLFARVKVTAEGYMRHQNWGKENTFRLSLSIQDKGEQISSIQAEPLSLIPYYPEYLDVTTLPASAATDLQFKSGDEDVVYVSEYGKVNAAKPGKTTITITDIRSGVSAVVPIEVADISLKRGGKSSYTLSVGDSRHLSATSNPAGLYQNWSSSNEGVVKVSEKGVIEAVGLGKATVTCGVADKDVSWNVTVNKMSLRAYCKPFDDWAYKGCSYDRKYFFTGNNYVVQNFEKPSFTSDSVFDTIKGYKSGKFISTSSAKAVSNGKKVMPLKTGTVKVVYRVSGTNYTVSLSNVHSVDTLKAKSRQAIKNRALVPSSVSISSMTFKAGTGSLKVRFTAMNAYGVRVSQTAYGYYSKGKFKLNW